VHRIRGSPAAVCVGVTPRASLYVAYSGIELLGACFYLRGDVQPEPDRALALPAKTMKTGTHIPGTDAPGTS
jgi:hypothetical protein